MHMKSEMPAMMQLTPAQPPMGMQPMQQPEPRQYATPGGPSYEVVVQQTPSHNTTYVEMWQEYTHTKLTNGVNRVYVGNLVPYVTQNDLVPLFQSFGYIVEIRLQADRGFAFVKLDTHENAAMAIVNLQGTPVHGRGIKVSWGKDNGTGQSAPAQAAAPDSGAYPVSVSLLLLAALN